MNYLLIKKVIVLGANKEPAEVTFKAGVNIVTGPSNTGKTYLYQLINFLLGGSTLPKKIDEALGYEKARIEISTSSNEVYTLERELKSNSKVTVCKCSLDNFDESTNAKTVLRSQRKRVDRNNISDFLLDLIGVSEVSIRNNSRNDRLAFSFRDLFHLSAVNENSIIDEIPPIFSGVTTRKTADKSAFDFIISGVESELHTKVEEPRIRKARLNAQIELINNEITKLSTRLTTVERDSRSLVQENRESYLEQAKQEISVINQKLDLLLLRRKDIADEIRKLNDELIGYDELIKRFNILKDQYSVDLERLKFVYEGSELINQIDNVLCPLCGEQIESLNQLIPSRDSIKAETKKIHARITDIELTINDTLSLRLETKDRLTAITEEEQKIVNDIEKHLKPSKDKLQKVIDIAISSNTHELEGQFIRNAIHNLSVQRQDLITLLNTPGILPQTSPTPDYNYFDRLCKEISNILKKWRFSPEPVVVFNTSTYDIEVDGKPRSGNGKGVMAILYSAFLLGLQINYFKNNLPGTGFVLIDSPLTSFEGEEGAEKLNNEVKEAFIKNLNYSQLLHQIIIFENKKSLPDLEGLNMNVIRFTRESGFFPLGDAALNPRI